MSDLSPHARDVLASARAELAPGAERIARGRDRLLAATAITATATAAGTAAAHATTTSAATTGAATTGATTATATTATATVGVTKATATATTATVVTTTAGITGVKLAAIGAGLAVVTGGGIVVVPRALESEPARPAIRAEAPARTPMPAPDRPVSDHARAPTAATGEGAIDPDMIELEPMTDEAPARPRAPRVRDPGAATATASSTAPGAGPAPAVNPLTRELALLRAARAGWKSGATVEALSTIATYQREFPRGQLAEEAAALELDLLCAAGRTDEAARNRARFLARWPASALRARVDRPCAAR